MAERPKVNVSMGGLVSPVFERIINEVDPEEIPARYIEHIKVKYLDGSEITLRGDDLAYPIPVHTKSNEFELVRIRSMVNYINITLDIALIETDANSKVELLLGGRC